MDLSGSWKLDDSANLADAELAVAHSAEKRLAGAAYYSTGVALVEGYVEKQASFWRAAISIIYDNPRVLGKWLSRGLASQAVGAYSSLVLEIPFDWDGRAPLPGVYQGFYLTHDRTGGNMLLYSADHPDVAKLHPPRLALLSRLR